MIKFNLRLPEDLYDAAKDAAATDDRSLNSWLVSLVRHAVAPRDTPNRPDGESAVPVPPRGSGPSPRP
ncbi:Arc family DNA-binding protein [Streptomyces canus]|uniref:Arc family DNA-binding protein n=1 Tax=Streptomyces canus TaxID=58343 RepID=UPI002E29B541|nr:Arc family DNA-binding protein [Streptomyces canus]